jgi:hypothetical protein
VASGTLARFQTATLSLSGVRHFKVEASARLLGTFGFDCCGIGGSLYFPTTDGATLVGREFVLRIPYLNGNVDFVVFAHEPSTVTFRNAAGVVVLSTTVPAGGAYVSNGSPLAAGAVYQVTATGDVSIVSTTLNGHAAVPARDGSDVGTDFLFATRDYETAGAAVFAYEAATVTAVNIASGATAFTRTLAAGEAAFVNGLGTGRFHLTSTGRVGVWAGSTQGGNALRDLGDDGLVTVGDHGRDFLVHSQRSGAFVFALENGTHVTINGSDYVLDRGQFKDLAAENVWRISSDKPLTVETFNTYGLDDWSETLRLVPR